MDIKSAKFIKSSQRHQDCPAPDRPEYAFIGRSNVGKSSLINMMTGRNKLAKVSSTPGKTQLINHFLIDDQWYLVDLPGYGWAQVSKTDKAKWKKMIDDYLLQRPNLVCVFVLIDSRHSPQKIDSEFMEWLGENGVPFCMIFTKLDKLKSSQKQSNINSYNQEMQNSWEDLPTQFITSSTEKLGKEELLKYINELNKSL